MMRRVISFSVSRLPANCLVHCVGRRTSAGEARNLPGPFNFRHHSVASRRLRICQSKCRLSSLAQPVLNGPFIQYGEYGYFTAYLPSCFAWGAEPSISSRIRVGKFKEDRWEIFITSGESDWWQPGRGDLVNVPEGVFAILLRYHHPRKGRTCIALEHLAQVFGYAASGLRIFHKLPIADNLVA